MKRHFPKSWSTTGAVLGLAAALAIAPAGQGADSTNSPVMTIGPAETLYTSISAFNIDMSCPTLKINDSEFYFWTENGDYSFKKFRGTLTAPFQTQVWSGYSGRWDFTGFPTGYNRYRPWLANIHRCEDGGLIGFVHVEKAAWDDPNCKYSIGLAYSSDGGDHWKYCGDILRNQGNDLPGQLNMGGCPLLVVGDYFYVYFNDFPASGGHAHTVARAPVADVVAAARTGTVTPWKKYNNGNWDQDGFTGVGSMILPSPDHYDLHSDAVYCAPLGQYLLTAWEQVGYTYPSGNPVLDSNRGIYLYTSDDGIHWGDRRHIYTPAAGGETPYAFFAGTEGATADCQVVGNTFYLLFPDRIHNKFFRIPFTIGDGNGADSSAAAPYFTPAEGLFPCEQAVLIRSTTADAVVRYTTDGSQPGPDNGLLYTGPVALAASTVLRAAATKDGMPGSGVSTGTFLIAVARVGLANGSFENQTNGWAVATSSGSPPAYGIVTNQGRSAGSHALALGNANAAGNALFTQTLATLPGAGYVLRFDYGAYGNAGRAQVLRTDVLEGSTILTSLVLTATATGNFDPAAMVLGSRSLAFTALSGATIIRFSDQTTLANSSSCDGMLDGIGVSGGGTVGAPLPAPPPGPLPPGTPITLAAVPADAAIRYTLDGSQPTSVSGLAYTGPIPLAGALTLRAMGFRTGMMDSPVSTGTYTLAAVPAFGALANGSFEMGTNGWVVESRDANPAAYAVAGDQGVTAGALALAFGNQNRAGNAVFSQTLSTVSGALYTVRFDYGGYGTAGKTQQILVTASNSGAEIARLQVAAYGTGSYLPSSTTFRRYTFPFRAVSTSTVIRFTDLTTLGDSLTCDGMLDNVEIRGGGTIIILAAQLVKKDTT